MRKIELLAVSLALASCQTSTLPLPYSSARDALALVDRQQSDIVQSGDMAALEALLHPRYTAHAPNGRVLNRAQIIAFARTGAFASEKHRRIQEHVIVSGDTGVVIGVDHLQTSPPLATRGERTRRYTNVYVREGGRWWHLSRHFHFLP